MGGGPPPSRTEYCVGGGPPPSSRTEYCVGGGPPDIVKHLWARVCQHT